MTIDLPTADEPVRIIHADCMDVLPRLPAGCVDAVVTDPPYGIALSNNDVDGHRREGGYGIAGDEDQAAGLQVLEWAARLPVIFFASPWKPWPGKWRNLIVWDKGGAVGGGGDIQRCLKRSWELIQVARNGPMSGDRGESVWRVPIVPADTAEHIAAKPVGLMRRLLRRFTKPNDVILDPFGGSGSTAVAAIAEGQRCILIERDPAYVAIARKRVEAAMCKTGLFEGVA